MGPWIQVYRCSDARWVVCVRFWRRWFVHAIDAR